MGAIAMMLSGAATGGGGGSAPGDIATLVTALGGDSVVRNFYDARTFVRTNGTSVLAVEDARQTSFGGRYVFPHGTADGIDCGRCTAFDGLTKATWIIWGVRYQTDGTYCAISTNSASSPFIIYHPSNFLRVLCGASSGIAEFTMSTAIVPLGAICKLMIVYDGTQASGSRVTAYYSIYSRSAGTWGSRTALTKTSDGAPASLATTSSETLRFGGWGSGATYSNPFGGCLDEVRMWAGTALTTTQLDAETLTSNPIAADFRYAFATNANNTGTISGNNGTVAGNVTLCASDLAYGSPLAGIAGSYATYDGSGAITFTSSGSPVFAGTPGFTQDGGLSMVVTEPTIAGNPTMSSLFGGSGSGSDEYLTTYKSGSTVNIWSAATGPSIASASAIRAIHSRHAGTGGSMTIGLQDGTGTEGTSTGSFCSTLPNLLVVGRGPSANPADIILRAAILLDGTITSTQRAAINSWAATHHGATV